MSLILTRRPGEAVIIGDKQLIIRLIKVEFTCMTFTSELRDTKTNKTMHSFTSELVVGNKLTIDINNNKHSIAMLNAGIKGNQVRLAFTADESISIHREEIYQRIEDERKAKKNDAQYNINCDYNDGTYNV